MAKRSGMATSETAGDTGADPAAGDGERRGVTLRPRMVAIGGVLVALALLGGGGLVLGQRQVALDTARIAAENLALAIAEQTARSVQAGDAVLLDLQEGAAEAGATSADAMRTMMAGPRFASWLHDSAVHLPQIEALLVTDTEGHVLNAAGRLPALRQAEAGAEAARHFAATPVAATPVAATPADALFIGAPAPEPAPIAGRKPWMLCLARVLALPDGTPAGVLVAVLRLDTFGSLYAGLRLHGTGMVALLHRDGTVLLRQPPLEQGGLRPPLDQGGLRPPLDQGGLRPRADSPWNDVVARGGGSFRSSAIFGGSERIIATRPLRDTDLVAAVGVDETAALAGWQRDAILGGVGALAACICILLLLHALLQQLRRLEQSQTTLQAANENLSRKARELETTLGYMDQGLVMVTPDQRVAVCNDRAIELLGLPPELMQGRPSFKSILDWQWQSGEFDQNDRAMLAMRQRGGFLDRPHTYERRRPKGQMIEVRSVPLEGGGVVRTYTDTTARALSEDRFRQIVNDSPLAIALIATEDERFVQVNPACCALVGYSAEELVGQPWQELVHPDDRAQMLARPTPEQGRVTVEARLVTGSGKAVWIRLTRSLLPAAPGRAPLRLAIGEDVTPQREMEARFREAQRLEAVGQHSPAASRTTSTTCSASSCWMPR